LLGDFRDQDLATEQRLRAQNLDGALRNFTSAHYDGSADRNFACEQIGR
jgi:hypothetical protein